MKEVTNFAKKLGLLLAVFALSLIFVAIIISTLSLIVTEEITENTRSWIVFLGMVFTIINVTYLFLIDKEI
jgi:hypothetical protein